MFYTNANWCSYVAFTGILFILCDCIFFTVLQSFLCGRKRIYVNVVEITLYINAEHIWFYLETEQGFY